MPPPIDDGVPESYVPCITAPTCKVSTGDYVTALGISDDGHTMATQRVKNLNRPDQYTALALLGIDSRTYTEIGRGGSSGAALSADGSRLVFASDSAGFGVAGDPDGPDLDVLVYDRSTGTVSRPTQPDGQLGSSPEGEPFLQVSADGRWALARSQAGLVFLDLVSGTYSVPFAGGRHPDLSADGRYIVWMEDTQASPLVRYDRVTGDTTPLGVIGSYPTISGDGSRIAYWKSRSPELGRWPTEVWMLEVGGSPVLVDDNYFTDENAHTLELSTEGSRLIVSVITSFTSCCALQVRSYNLATGAHTIAGPNDATAVAVSFNARHVISRSVDGEFRWNG
jgi:hypothetical protein